MTKKELIYWANQHGQGIVIRGELGRKIQIAAAIEGITPEEFVTRALNDLAKDEND